MSTPNSPGPEKSKTLVSWKEIAAFLGRAERTVKRWERERGLPVHRILGGERGGVFAYPEELRAWLLGELGLTAPDSPPAHERRRGRDRRHPVATPSPAVTDSASSPQPAKDSVATPSALATYRPLFEWAAAVALIFGLVIGTVLLVDHSSLASARGRANSPGSGASSHIAKPKVENLYLQGRYQWSLRTADSLARSADLYSQAILLDPQYAQAYAGLAETYELLPEYGHANQAESYARAKLAAARAIELDPNLAAGHRALAFLLFWSDWDVPRSDAEFRRALALAPNEEETHHWYATTLQARQQYPEAVAQADEAVRLAPTNPAIAADDAWIHADIRADRASAINTLRELARTQSQLVKPSRYLARLEFEDENYTGFLADLQSAASISHDPDEIALADAAARGWEHGGKAGLLEAVRTTQKSSFDRGNASGFALARTYLQLGEPREALPYFNNAFDRNDYNLMTLPGCTCIAGLRSDPDYARLLRRIHLRMHMPAAALTDIAAAAIPRTAQISGIR